jgi:polar amino acid transport system permease protein
VIWDWSFFFSYLTDPRIAAAAGTTLAVATAAQVLATVIGVAAALGLRSAFKALRGIIHGYIWLFRGTPPLVQLLLFYFGLAQLGLRLSVLQASLACLSLYGGAYMTIFVRTALDSIDRGQVEAARSLGLSRFETLRSVMMPQALRILLPPFGNEFASMMRTTSLLSVISFEELLRVTNQAINQTFRPLELYAVAALYYLAMTTLWMLVQHRLERRLDTSRREAGRTTIATAMPGISAS